MRDIEAPEADAIEQSLPLAGEPAAEDPPEVGIEVPEADAVEQAQQDETAPRRPRLTIRDDVPEADALDQDFLVDLDEDAYRG